MKSLIISSNSSGGGKTTITLGLMRALSKRGHRIQGYKVGPDYIDPAFHTMVTGNSSRNLDTYLMGETGVKAAYNRGIGDLGVIEGVMGLYDGKGITSEYSTAALSKLLKLPVVLVMTPKSQSITLCAELNGIRDFEDIEIAGIILNNINESYYKLLKAAIEKNCKLKVFGYVPKNEDLILESRHLGLVQSSEVQNLNSKIEKCSELIESYVDLESLMKHFQNIGEFKDEFHIEKKKKRVAVALDKAFSFYYKENLELLEECCDVEYFSPLKDKKLPKAVDFLYLGGGYPEVFIEELSSNKNLMLEISAKLNEGLHCYAECGGLMYLTEAIEGKETVGFFKGTSHMSTRLQNFGYAEINIDEKNHIMKQNIKVNCHEFHRSYVKLEEKTIYKVKKTSYDLSNKEWNCGYLKNNTLAGYAHVHFFGNIDFIENLIK
jgi:cobyrinic acid a,c-diamide synthase